jgi:hypothetical protein
LTVDSPRGFRLPWKGSATLDGEIWNATDGEWLLVPRGAHRIGHAEADKSPHLIDFNGDIDSIRFSAKKVDLRYTSATRALAKLDCLVTALQVDGSEVVPLQIGSTLLLPSGKRHAVVLCK